MLENVNFPLIGTPAPEFIAQTTQGTINFPSDFKGKWVILFSHPADFTPVCTTEFMTFASMHEEFKALNTELVGLSIDSIHSHLAWLQAIRGYTWNGIEKPAVEFRLCRPQDGSRQKYGMLQGDPTLPLSARLLHRSRGL